MSHTLALIVTFVALLAPIVHAQQELINYAALPACAQQCTPLQTAEKGCVPQGGITSQETYVSCFCQSDFLKTFYQTASGICDAQCTSTSDQSTIQQWYINFCRNGQGGVSSSAASSPGTSSTATSAAAGDSTSTSNSHASLNDPDGDGDTHNNYSGSWISAHWKWVVMLIVIFLAMAIFSILGVCLKRRHRAKHDAMRANLAAPEAGGGIDAVPPPPAMAHLKSGTNDSGTLASTADLSTVTAASRPRSRTNTLTRFPNGSMSNVAPPPAPVVWGPHQHMAASRGYEYHPPVSSPSPGPSGPPTPVSIPTPTMSPVGYQRFSGGAPSNAKSRSRDAINEVADEDRIEHMHAGGAGPSKPRRKLSKHR